MKSARINNPIKNDGTNYEVIIHTAKVLESRRVKLRRSLRNPLLYSPSNFVDEKTEPIEGE